MAYGKGRATGYTDFYKNSSKSPNSSYGSVDDEENSSVDTVEKRRAAIKRRLKARKVGI